MESGSVGGREEAGPWSSGEPPCHPSLEGRTHFCPPDLRQLGLGVGQAGEAAGPWEVGRGLSPRVQSLPWAEAFIGPLKI